MHKKAVLKEAINWQKQNFNTVKTTKPGENLAMPEKCREEHVASSPKGEICALADDCKVIENVSRKRKQLDDNDQSADGKTNSTVLHCEKKTKIEKKKITVAEYFARKRQENEMKKCPINENANKRKRALSEQKDTYNNKNCLNPLAEVLDVFCFNALKKPKLSDD